ncbi:MAG: PAS domain S-box protein [Candidatus Cloacimonetes bacterium]|nr:PAS domain S-box protein [Candidatus Cloacimonadota bacterium]MDY0229365.1 LytS/YhcK type 5TM receptor domain-containing protein [Candidatus Cloacimonadaceae bacterium]
MILDIFESLIYNAGLLLTLTIAYDIIINHNPDNRMKGKIFSGIIIGVIGLAIMIHPWALETGTVIDARTILFSIAAVFFGAIPALIGGVMAITYRILMGGAGVYVGVSTIISSIFWGLVWRFWHQRRGSAYSLMGLYQLGVVNHISMILLMFLLPKEIRWQMLQVAAIPVLVLYPLVTVLMGQIMLRRRQRQREKLALEKSEQEYRLLAETTKDMIVLHDIAGNIGYSNKMAKDFFSKEALQEGGKNIKQFILPESLLMMEGYVKERRAGLTEPRMYQMQVWDAQGQVKTVEINSTILSGEGEDALFIAAIRDITERIRNEEQTARYANRLEVLRELDRIVLENLPFEQVCTVAMKKLQALIPFKILMISSIKDNTIRFLAIQKPELRHRYLNTNDHFPNNMGFCTHLLSVKNYVISDTALAETKNMPIRAALIKEGMNSFMFNGMIAENELVGFLWFGSDKMNAFGPEHLEAGQEFANQVVIVLHQLELKQQIKDYAQDLEKQVDLRTNQLKHSMHEMESFSYSVADDLQAPLRRISKYAEALEKSHEAQLRAEGKDILQAIRNQAMRMSNVIPELLKIAQVNSDAIHKEKLDMREIVRRQLNYVPEDFAVTEDSLLTCQGDATLIEVVWKNLIENAVKFSIPAPLHKIHIGCELTGDRVVYFVQDQGVGFDPAFKDKVFDPFKRLHFPDEFEGNGIGLALTKKIVLHHDGEIWAESTLGQGSTFYFSLPYSAD